MRNFREIANEFKGTNFEFTKDNRKTYSKAIKGLVPTVNGNAELSDIVKKWLNTTARVLGDESYKLVKNDPIVYARLLEIASTFVENPNPRYIKVSRVDYYHIARDSKFEEQADGTRILVVKDKIEELVSGTWFKMARLKDGEIVIYEIEDNTPLNKWSQEMLFGEVVTNAMKQ